MRNNVFSVALNHQSQTVAWGEAFRQAPYQSPPKTPVWFIKPHNTVIGTLTQIPYPSDEPEVLSGGTLAIVIGKTVRKVSTEQAGEFIAGYTLANDISLPETCFYRPAIKAKCCDGFCPMGEDIANLNPDRLIITTEINGVITHQWNTADLVRSAHQLVGALTEFITLNPGDKILIGTPHQRVQLHPGDRVTIRAEGFSPLTNTISPRGDGI